MKRTVFVNLICSLVAVLVIAIGVIFVTTLNELSVPKLVISSENASAVYNGKPLTNDTWTLVSGTLQNGHTMSVEVTGMQTDVGISPNTVSAKIFDREGNDVSDKYELEYEVGLLEVTPCEITVTAGSAVKQHDGTPLTCDEYDISSASSVEVTHTIDVTIEGSITEVGQTDNLVSEVLIKNQSGVDVTKNYKINTINGTLVITPRGIVITAGSTMKTYDGTPLEYDEYTILSEEGLLTDQIIEVIIEGSITDVGVAENVITSVVIKTTAGEDVTEDYEIHLVKGTLTVIPCDLTITAQSDIKWYDGTPLTCDEYMTSSSVPVPNSYEISVDIEGSITEIGQTPNVVERVAITNENGDDVSHNYSIHLVDGTLTVTECDIVITAGSDSKEYDGAPLTCDQYYISSWINPNLELYFDVTIEGSITNVGEISNVIADVIITNSDGENITNNFTIHTVDGTLTVIEKNILLTAGSATKRYDGTPLTCNEYSISSSLGLVYGHEIQNIVIEGSITEIGQTSNTITSVTIVDGEGEDVTRNYNIHTVDGTLVVTQCDIVVTAGSTSKVYDGTPLTYDEYYISSLSSDMSSFIYHATVEGSITEIGQIDNVVTDFAITSLNGDDVTSNYSIHYVNGTLTVTPRSMLIAAQSASKQYDGTPLTCNEYFLSNSLGLISGHSMEVTIDGSITNIGQTDNKIVSVVIKNTFDQDVTDNYDIFTVDGTLVVTARELYITAGSASKPYDGTPLTCNEYEISFSDGVINGHNIHVEIEGSITEIGETDNIITEVRITDQGNNDITHFYNIHTYPGTLKIYESSNENTPGGNTPGGDTSDENTPNGSLGGGGNTGNQLLFTVVSEKTGSIYLKEHSFGDYDIAAKSFVNAAEYNLLIDSASAYYLPSYALNNGGASTYSITIDSKCGLFVLPYYTANGNYLQTSDVLVKGDASSPYTLEYYHWMGTAGVVLPSKYAAYEDAYYQFVKENYLYVDPETAEFMRTIIQQNGFSATDPSIINKVAKYIQNAAYYNLNYDLKMDQEANPFIAFLSKYKEGLCRHYAASATMLFRSLGIPARYTVGYMADVMANTVTNVTAERGHAWVEVYVEDIGWLAVEVTGSSAPETIKMSIKPVDIRVQYTDGNVLSASNAVTGFSLSQGYRYNAVIEGCVEGLGKATSTIVEFEIFAPDGTLVYQKSTGLGADKYDIVYKDGVLQQYLSAVSFTSQSKSKTYDGTPLTTMTAECYLTSGNTFAELGYSYVITPIGSINNVGSTAATYTVKFYKDNVDCTDHFYISAKYGTLTLNTKSITIHAESAQKPFDGSPLKANSISYSQSDLAEGDYIRSYTVVGSQTNIGKSSNTIEHIIICNSQGEDVTKNYQIILEDGLLFVTKP